MSNSFNENICAGLPKSQADLNVQAQRYAGLQSQGQSTNQPSDPRTAQLLALFNALDERGKKTTLAMLAVAVKLHPQEK